MLKKIVCIGDSIVLGRIDEISQGWAGLLRHWHVNNDPVSNIVYNLGIGGNTSADVLKRIRAECQARKPDLIIVGLGVNDFRHMNSPGGPFLVPPEEFKHNTITILQTAKSISNRVLMCEMVPIDEARTCPHKGHYWFQADQDTYSEIIAEICVVEGIDLVKFDLLKKFKREQISVDGIHPGSKAHVLMFDAVRNHISENCL